MIVRPTTSQLLRDVRNELVETIAPEVTSATAQVALEQIDIILEQCAVRAENENHVDGPKRLPRWTTSSGG